MHITTWFSHPSPVLWKKKTDWKRQKYIHLFTYFMLHFLGSAIGGQHRGDFEAQPVKSSNYSSIPTSKFPLAEKHVFGLKVTVVSRERQLICWRGTRAKMVAGVCQINSLLRWIFDVALCSVPISASGVGSPHLNLIPFSTSTKTKSAQNMALLSPLTYIYTRVAGKTLTLIIWVSVSL